jgi:hypothetical protein
MHLVPLSVVLTAVFLAAAGQAQQPPPDRTRIVLGRPISGTSIFLVRSAAGWGIEIAGRHRARLSQANPVAVEFYRNESEIRNLAAGYTRIIRKPNGATASGVLDAGNGTKFFISDEWSIDGDVLSLSRKLEVRGTAEGGGFGSAIRFQSDPDVTWPDVAFLAPSLLYGDTTYNGRGPGGVQYERARRYSFREDYLPAPPLGVSFKNGHSVTILDESPNAHTVTQERAIDDHLSFGAFRANETTEGGIEFGFWMPGTTASISAGREGGFFCSRAGEQTTEPLKPGPPEVVQFTWNWRYNPVRDGFAQSYRLGFRLASRESFPDLIRNSYRWAWRVLAPAANWLDLHVVRRSLADQLSSQVYTIEGRTGIPFIVSSVTGKVWSNADPNFFWRATMGFVGKNIEAADQLLREADRDPTECGRKMRQQGLDIIGTFIRSVPMSPPVSTGVNLRTGAPSMTNSPQWFIREAKDDMRMLMEEYDRERKAARRHPEWLEWCKQFADWALTLQRPDGSFPRSYMVNTQDVAQASGTTSYNVAPLFPMLSKELDDARYLDSAVRAAEYVWQNFGSCGIFIGGAIDNPNITDKEAGMLSLEAFLSLYEATRQPKWLRRAQIAADFAETWMWI